MHEVNAIRTSPTIDQEAADKVNGAMQMVAPVPATFDSFSDYLEYADKNGISEVLLDFLTDQGNTAGAAPAQWMKLSNVGAQPWHKELHERTRRNITIAIIGPDAFKTYVEWFLTRETGEPQTISEVRTGE